MTRIPAAAACACLALLLPAGCADFSEVDSAAAARITGTPSLPVIAPVDGILGQAAAITITDADTAALRQRAAGVQARGAAIQGPVGDPETVARLTAALPAP